MKWHNRFADMAAHISEWSKDPSTKVGAVIVKDRIILATGYNGLPKGVDDIEDRLSDRKKKYPMTVHAELNAILQSATSLNGSTIYVTHHPCADCAGAIIQAGIKKVYVKTPGEKLNDNWTDSTKFARTMFGEAGVKVVDLNDLDDTPQLRAV